MTPICTFASNQRISLVWAGGTAFLAVERELQRLEGDRFRALVQFTDRVHQMQASADGGFLGFGCSRVGYITDVEGNVTTTIDAAVCKAGVDAVIPLDGTRALVHLSGNGLGLWSPEGFRPFEQKARHSSAYEALSPDHRWAVAIGAEAMTRLFDVGSGKQIKTLNEGCDGSCSVAFSADGAILAHGRRKGGNAIVLRSVGKKWSEVQTIPLPAFDGASVRVGPSRLGFSPDAARIWVVEHDIGTSARLTVWQRESGTLLHEVLLPGGASRVWPWRATGDGHTILVVMHSADGSNLHRFVLP